MNSSQINQLMKRHPQTRGIFDGVYAADTLPFKPRYRKPCAYIVNTDPISKPGRHWVALYFGKSSVEYYDSSGAAPLPEFLRFMGTWNYIRNAYPIQSFISSACGQHCIFYIWKKTQGLGMYDIIKQFDKEDLIQNDLFVTNTIEKHFRTDLDIIDIGFLVNQICRKIGCE